VLHIKGPAIQVVAASIWVISTSGTNQYLGMASSVLMGRLITVILHAVDDDGKRVLSGTLTIGPPTVFDRVLSWTFS
jgi:hypothetical protein